MLRKNVQIYGSFFGLIGRLAFSDKQCIVGETWADQETNVTLRTLGRDTVPSPWLAYLELSSN